MTQLSFLDKALPEDKTNQPMHWQASRQAGEARLASFLPEAGRAYASMRNYDFGPNRRDNISCLSPWIKHRLILEEDVLRATLSVHSQSSAEKFIQEVFWRGYFKGWLEQHPDVWNNYMGDLEIELEKLERYGDLRVRYEAAIDGTTGIDCFDSWSEELIATGYLHNHARMWFASIWIFTLGLPWQLGADFFYRHLLDGDAASNTLSWRWVGGLHTKGKTYLARASNIEKYTDGRFSPQGLASDAPPLFEEETPALSSLPMLEPLPLQTPYGLLISEEDCQAETLPLPQSPKAILAVSTSNRRSPLPVSPLVQNFTTQALDDSLSRLSQHFDGQTGNQASEAESRTIVEWAQRNDVSTIVTAYAPIGPTRDYLTALERDLEKENIRLYMIKRPYDSITWPYATKGFFKLKQKIPDILKKLNFGDLSA